MPDRTEANPNELNQDDARYGFRCCHLTNTWTAPLPPETELSRQMTTSTTSFYFSSRRRHTRWNCDWSSDVCSSDLLNPYDARGASVCIAKGEIWPTRRSPLIIR